MHAKSRGATRIFRCLQRLKRRRRLNRSEKQKGSVMPIREIVVVAGVRRPAFSLTPPSISLFASISWFHPKKLCSPTVFWRQGARSRGWANVCYRTLSLLALSGVVLVTPLHGGCAGIDTAQWTEEVKLHDGTMIKIKRKARRQSSGFPTAHRGPLIEQELLYKPLGIYWKNVIAEDGRLDPLSFEVFDGFAYLTLSIESEELCNGKLPSDYSAQFLSWRNGEWKEVAATDFPFEKALINVYEGYWGRDSSEDAKELVKWEEKASKDGFIRATRFGSEIVPQNLKAYLDIRFKCGRLQSKREVRTY